MIKNIKIRVLPQVWRDAEQLEAQICREFAVSRKALHGLRMKHTSIDARQRQVMVQLDVDLYINEEPPQQTFRKVVYQELPSHAHQARPCSAAATSRMASSPNGSKGRGRQSGSHSPRMAAALAITRRLPP